MPDKNKMSEKNINYAFPMWICGAVIITTASIWALLSGIVGDFDTAITEIKSLNSSTSLSTEIIRELKNSSLPELMDLKREIESLKNDFEIQNSHFVEDLKNDLEIQDSQFLGTFR